MSRRRPPSRRPEAPGIGPRTLTMNGKQFLNRFKTDYDFKTFVTSFISLAVTVVFAFYNGFLGIYHASLWHGTIIQTTRAYHKCCRLRQSPVR